MAEPDASGRLALEEYVEQAYLFRMLRERLGGDYTLQDLLAQSRHEVLATTKLPFAIDFLAAELKHRGVLSDGMRRLSHYFSPFQAFVVAEAEMEKGRFDFMIALQILQAEAEACSQELSCQGLFFFQFESLCRNRLSYDRGLQAMAEDRRYDEHWRPWLLIVRRQLGLVELADLIYGRSEAYLQEYRRRHGEDASPQVPVLFGPKEGKIAYAHRRRDPLLLFAAMQRHLGYPEVPRPKSIDPNRDLVPLLQRRLERLEARLKLLEEEQRYEAVDITRFYQPPDKRPGESRGG